MGEFGFAVSVKLVMVAGSERGVKVQRARVRAAKCWERDAFPLSVWPGHEVTQDAASPDRLSYPDRARASTRRPMGA